jgi:putative peptidoglycan lipid II flippase
MVNILARAFYALGDTQTPMKVSVFCLGANLVLSLLFITEFRQAGLGLANTLTSVLNVWLLLRALRKKLGELELAEVKRSGKAVLGAMIVGGIFAFGVHLLWEGQLGHGTPALRLGEVFVPAGFAALMYGAVLWADKLPAALEVAALIGRKLRRRVA